MTGVAVGVNGVPCYDPFEHSTREYVHPFEIGEFDDCDESGRNE